MKAETRPSSQWPPTVSVIVIRVRHEHEQRATSTKKGRKTRSPSKGAFAGIQQKKTEVLP